MVNVIEVDHDKCTGCQSCTIVCAVQKEGIANPLLGRIQISRFESEGVHVPSVCRQCEDMPCRKVCPVEDALVQDPESHVVMIDYDRCIGCHECVTACPFAAMQVNHKTGKIFKCDHCQGDPICVKVCHPEAIKYVPITDALYRKRAATAQKLRNID